MSLEELMDVEVVSVSLFKESKRNAAASVERYAEKDVSTADHSFSMLQGQLSY